MDPARIDALKWWLNKYARISASAADALAYIRSLEARLAELEPAHPSTAEVQHAD